MKYIHSCIALIATFLLLAINAQAEPQAQDEGIEVLARGPVHEAYAEPILRDKSDNAERNTAKAIWIFGSGWGLPNFEESDKSVDAIRERNGNASRR